MCGLLFFRFLKCFADFVFQHCSMYLRSWSARNRISAGTGPGSYCTCISGQKLGNITNIPDFNVPIHVLLKGSCRILARSCKIFRIFARIFTRSLNTQVTMYPDLSFCLTGMFQIGTTVLAIVTQTTL